VLLGIFLVTAIAVVIANLITDILYAALDPRVRSSYGRHA
jgi:peptide/nickel transport system permease protein